MKLSGKRAAPLKRTSRGRSGGQDPENQTERISTFIRELGMYQVSGWTKAASAFTDGDTHWTRTFNEIKAAFDRHEFDVVVVLRAERFSRRAKRGLRILWDLEDAGITVLSVEDEEFSPDRKGSFPLTRLAMKLEIAEEESTVKSHRTREGHAKGDRAGSPRGRVPTGYVLIGGKREKSIVKSDRADGVAEFIETVAAGKSVRESRVFAGVSQATASKIIANDAYSIGYWQVKSSDGRTLKFDCPPLVTRDVQLRARAVAASRAGERSGRRTNAIEREDFSALVRCHCGRKLYVTNAGDTRYTYYKCERGHTAPEPKVTREINRQMSASRVLRAEKVYEGAGAGHRELSAIETEIAAFDPASGDLERLAWLRARRTELEESGTAEPENVRLVSSSTAYGRLWAAASHAEKLAILASGELKVEVTEAKEVEVKYLWATELKGDVLNRPPRR